jgi:hypothetical protein
MSPRLTTRQVENRLAYVEKYLAELRRKRERARERAKFYRRRLRLETQP